MKKYSRWMSINLLAIFITFIVTGAAFAKDEKKTIEGVVTESYQIVADNNEVYDLGESEAGDQIIEQAGKRVKATGKVEYDQETDSRTITVESFKVIEDAQKTEEIEE